MADGSFPGLVSKDRNINAVANPIFVELSDGAAALGTVGNPVFVDITDATIAVTQSGVWDIGTVTTLTGITNDVNIADGGNSITVDNAGTFAVQVDGDALTALQLIDNLVLLEDTVHVTGDAGVQALAVRNDTLASLVSADGDYAPLQVDADGALYVNATITINTEYVDDSAFTVATDYVGAIGALADETSPDVVQEGDIGIPRMTLDRKLIIEIADATTDGNRLAVNSDGSLNVNQVSAAITGEVHDYDTASAVASDATSNHDYTVANTTMLLRSVIVSGSGNIKFEIQTGPLASLATVAVGFLTGRQGDTKQINFDPAVEVPVTSTGTVRVIRTNRQGAATDLYSTIIGQDI